MLGLYKLARPVLFQMEPEKAHRMTLRALKSGMMPMPKSFKSDTLSQEVLGMTFSNPVGLAAGFDKNAEVIGPAFRMGFGFVEAGTVTPKPQFGNPRPRVFRDPKSESVINRLGFPNEGLQGFEENLDAFLSSDEKRAGVVGINIGMNKDTTDPAQDYVKLIKALAIKSDYMTVNISSPNTAGLRDLQAKDELAKLLGQLVEAKLQATGAYPPPPLFVKLAPDLTEEAQEGIAETLLKSEIDGIILTNTTISRPDYLDKAYRARPGGLSGAPVRDMSTEVIRNFYTLTGGKLPIIGVGGVFNGQHAYEKIKAGASLVQLYTGLIYEGPEIVLNICKELITLLRKDGYGNVSEAIGIEAKKETEYAA